MKHLFPFYVLEGSKLPFLLNLGCAVLNGLTAGITVSIAALIVKAVI